MAKNILVTDSLFILDEQVKKIEAAGYSVERLDKPLATEEELCQAIKGKIGYILGGTEDVTQKIIDAADELKAIVFTGIGYKDHISAWESATKKGIAIANTPDGPTQAVAEWAVTAALLMNRDFIGLGPSGDKTFETTKGLQDQAIGIIGFGRTGYRIAQMLEVFKPTSISYYSRKRHDDQKIASYKALDELLSSSDVIFLCVSKDAGDSFINKQQLAKMKDGALLVSFMAPGIINEDALFAELQSGRLRAISDLPLDEKFNKLPASNWYRFNGSNAFNTETEIRQTSDMATDSLLNILQSGTDANLVNPEYNK